MIAVWCGSETFERIRNDVVSL